LRAEQAELFDTQWPRKQLLLETPRRGRHDWDCVAALPILLSFLASSFMPQIIPVGDLSPHDRFAIVVARWNESVTQKLLDGAIAKLREHGVAEDAIDVAWVPGSFEIPLAAQRMATSGRYAAVLCLGAVIRGETSHDQHINRSVSLAISQLALSTNVPVLFGVLTCETMEQAIHRAGGNVGNKGAECADAALHMVGLLKNLPENKVSGVRFQVSDSDT
jgi:6,7-dimethyl-8-ribityllumazine synthase